MAAKIRKVIGRLLLAVGPFASLVTAIVALVLFALLPVVKLTRAHVDENGLIGETPGRPWPTAVDVLRVPTRGACFTEERIHGTFMQAHTAFYVIVNSAKRASLDAANRVAASWRVNKRALAFEAVFLVAANRSCVDQHLSSALDPAFRLKGAVILDHTSFALANLCIDYISDFGTQPNHDFAIVALLEHRHLACVKPLSRALEAVATLSRQVAAALGYHLTQATMAPYLYNLDRLVRAFTERDAEHSPLTTLHLGVGGYPPAFIVEDVQPGLVPPNLEGPNDGAVIVDRLGWTMNHMNERLHHSFAVWFPVSPSSFVENNIAQLQALVVVAGLLTTTYFCWIVVPRLHNVVLAVDTALVCFVASAPWAAHAMGMTPSLATWASLGASVWPLYSFVRRTTTLMDQTTASASVPVALLGIGLLLFSLSALSPATANILGVGVGLCCIRLPLRHRATWTVATGVRLLCLPLGGLFIYAFLETSTSGMVASVIALAAYANAASFT